MGWPTDCCKVTPKEKVSVVDGNLVQKGRVTPVDLLQEGEAVLPEVALRFSQTTQQPQR